MINLLRAEWQKVFGNALLMGFTVGAFPIGALGFVLFSILWVLVMPDAGFITSQWTNVMINTWGLITSFPTNVFMRVFVVAFMAATIAGEYEWHTWKNLVPRAPRRALIPVKFIVMAVTVVASLFATSLIAAHGMWLPYAIEGISYGPALTGEVLREFLPAYFLEMALSLGGALVMTGFATFAVMLTRSLVGGLVLGIGLSLVEGMGGLMLQFVSFIFSAPGLVNLYAFSPTYCMENIRSWVIDSVMLPTIYYPNFTAGQTLTGSIIISVLWVIGLIALCTLMFERQDIVN
nr:hypothetical protein [Anaerolineae bacterium]